MKNLIRPVKRSKQGRTNTNPPLRILLENMASQKNSIGSKFEEIRLLLDKLKPNGFFGVCLDTSHAFASGYDLRGEKEVEITVDSFASIVGRALKSAGFGISRSRLYQSFWRPELMTGGPVPN